MLLMCGRKAGCIVSVIHIKSEKYRNLTQQELNILKWVALGKTDKVIAGLLGVKEKDVSHYLHGIIKDLNTRDRVEAGLKAIKLGLV